MINDIANILKTQIEGLTWIEIIEGIVKPLKYTQKGGKEVTIPAVINATPTLCQQGKYLDLVPNSKKKSIIYFEDQGFDETDSFTCHYLRYSAMLRLISWVNLKLINQTYNSTTLLEQSIIKAINYQLANSNPYVKITARLEKMIQKGADLFGDYNYKEVQSQFITYPYDAFGMDWKVEFSIHKSCILDVILDPAIC